MERLMNEKLHSLFLDSGDEGAFFICRNTFFSLLYDFLFSWCTTYNISSSSFC